MGTRAATTYATYCPHDLKHFLFCRKRFIDDIFFILCGLYELLEKFHPFLNSVHPTMKFDECEHEQ